jgi:hypothetical protein
MRGWVAAAALVAALGGAGGCRPESDYAPRDLSWPALYCPSSPPTGTEYECEPTAIPYCTYPDLQVTCYCQTLANGRHALVCPPPDLGGSD